MLPIEPTAACRSDLRALSLPPAGRAAVISWHWLTNDDGVDWQTSMHGSHPHGWPVVSYRPSVGAHLFVCFSIDSTCMEATIRFSRDLSGPYSPPREGTWPWTTGCRAVTTAGLISRALPCLDGWPPPPFTGAPCDGGKHIDLGHIDIYISPTSLGQVLAFAKYFWDFSECLRHWVKQSFR